MATCYECVFHHLWFPQAQYDRGLLISKGLSAKTNFPTSCYEAEVEEYKRSLLVRCGSDAGLAMQKEALKYLLPKGGKQVVVKNNGELDSVVFDGWDEVR